ncbi:hypothetical protein [Methyloceanibacter sp.]|uniref:hypothetical protein n=1 Tax=Methyloceanibacter sp. TaxID=1965321 RepID=UPI003D6D9EBB
MRKVLRVTAAAAAGLTLLACNRPPRPQEAVYAPPPAQTYGNGPYARADLPPAAPPQTYGRAPYGRADVPPQVPSPHASYGRGDVPPQAPPTRAYDSASYGRADVPQQDQRLVWKSSPRWATKENNPKREADAGPVKHEAPSKLRLAQAKAAKVGVENLTGEDIEGLSSADLKELRGY